MNNSFHTREVILNFHGLGEPHPLVPSDEQKFWWKAPSFTRLLGEIAARPTSLDPGVQITFDDGNASDVLVALPELVKRGFRASFFICAGRIGAAHYVDAPMIKDLLSANMIVGSHGMHHRNWRNLNKVELDIEVGDARKKLQDIVQRPVDVVAIPFGSYDRRVLNRLTREPWQSIYTSDRGVARVDAKIKPRETMLRSMQDRNLRELVLLAPVHTRAIRTLSQLYKRVR